MKKPSWCEKHFKICQAVSELQSSSSHFNRTALYCFTGFYDSSTCAWTDYYLSEWEQLHVTRICENGGIVVGLHSYHKGGNEDRDWKFHCCTVSLVSFHILISE